MSTEVESVDTTYTENSFGQTNTKELTLILTEQEFKRVEAGSFYNNYDFMEDYVKDVVLSEIEADKQRHINSKSSSKPKK